MRNMRLGIVLGMFACVMVLLGFGKTTQIDAPPLLPVTLEIASTAPSETRIAPVGVQERSLTLERLKPLLVSRPGAGYKQSVIVKHSRYLSPIRGVGLRGNSRRWGDADLSVQAECVNRLVHSLRLAGYSRREIAFALVLWRCESGFNPDAAAGTSSACGLGQFLDRTRATLCIRAGILNIDPFAVDLNVTCTRETLRECFTFARKHASPGTALYFEYAYAYHHDGPSLNSGGREIARQSVLPWLETAMRCISE